MTTLNSHITIRPAYADDQLGLLRLAGLDSARTVPPFPLLVAEVGGELRAAVSVRDGSVIADPFYPTLHLIEMLRSHAADSMRERATQGRRLRLRAPRAQLHGAS
jgi:hypothetical protein